MPNYYYYPVPISSGSQPPSGQYVLKSGDTMSGVLNMGGNKIDDLPPASTANEPATKTQLDAVAATIGSSLPLAGGTMTGDINMDSNSLNLANNITAQSLDVGNITGVTKITSNDVEVNEALILKFGSITRVLDLSTKTISDLISTTIGGTSIEQEAYGARTIKVRANEALETGIVVSYVTVTSNASVLSVAPCLPSNGEAGQSSQPVGVTLTKAAAAGDFIDVCISGICTVQASQNTTPAGGAAVSVVGTNGKCTVSSVQGNGAVIGICLSSSALVPPNGGILVDVCNAYENY